MDYPKLYPIEISPVEAEGRQLLCLRDALQYVTEAVIIPREIFPILQYFDGRHTILDIQTQHARKTGGILFSDVIRQIADELDSRLMMDSEKFHEHQREFEKAFREQTTRPAMHAGGAYPNNAEELKNRLMGYFQPPDGPGLPNTSMVSDSSLVGAIVPHIDLRRGGSCFAHTYKDILEQSHSRRSFYCTQHGVKLHFFYGKHRV